MAHKVTLIPGDGIGPEVMQATVRILEATGVKFEWESFAAGAEAFAKYKEYIPKELTESIERTRVGLKGPVTTPIGGGFSSINVELRKKFELFANFRHRLQVLALLLARLGDRVGRSLFRLSAAAIVKIKSGVDAAGKIFVTDVGQVVRIRLSDFTMLGQASSTDIIGKNPAASVVQNHGPAEITEATALALMDDIATAQK